MHFVFHFHTSLVFSLLICIVRFALIAVLLCVWSNALDFSISLLVVLVTNANCEL